MTSILFDIVRICRSRLKCNYFKNKKTFSFLCSISGIYIRFWTFWKKRWSSYRFYFGNYRLWKTCLDHSLKNSVSGHLSRANMLKGPKLLQKEHENTFIIFSHHSERTWFGKYLPQLYFKSYGCFVTRWLPMTTILFGNDRICCTWFKCNYLENG